MKKVGTDEKIPEVSKETEGPLSVWKQVNMDVHHIKVRGKEKQMCVSPVCSEYPTYPAVPLYNTRPSSERSKDLDPVPTNSDPRQSYIRDLRTLSFNLCTRLRTRYDPRLPCIQFIHTTSSVPDTTLRRHITRTINNKYNTPSLRSQ